MPDPIPSPTCLTIYGRDGCPYCHNACVLADTNGIPMKYYDIIEYPDYKSHIPKDASEHKTVPVILWNGKFIGGKDELEKMIKNGTIACWKCEE